MDLTVDREGFRNHNPSPDEVLANTRPDCRDGVSSAWEVRSYGSRLLLLGNVDLAGVLSWHILLPFEQVTPDGDAETRTVEVFPPPSDNVSIAWCWRPLDAENWRPVPWQDVAARIVSGAGRDLHKGMIDELREEGEDLSPQVLSPVTGRACKRLEVELKQRLPTYHGVRVVPQSDSAVRIVLRKRRVRVTLESLGDRDALAHIVELLKIDASALRDGEPEGSAA